MQQSKVSTRDDELHGFDQHDRPVQSPLHHRGRNDRDVFARSIEIGESNIKIATRKQVRALPNVRSQNVI